MKVTFNTKDLKDVLTVIKHGIDRKLYLPILKQVKVDCTDGTPVFTTNSLKVAVVHAPDIQCKIQEPGVALVEYQVLYDYLKTWKGKTVTISDDGLNTMVNDMIQIEYMTDAIEEYPPVADIKLTHKINDLILADMIKTSVCADTDEIKEYLCGVYVHLNTGADLVATDGKRIQRILANDNKYKELSFIYPLYAIECLELLTGTVSLGYKDNQAMFRDRQTQLVVRTIEGDFPDYKAVIAPIDKNDIIVEIDKAMLNSLELIAPAKMKKDELYPIRLDVYAKGNQASRQGEGIHMAIKRMVDVEDEEKGWHKANSFYRCQPQGSVSININYQYLKEALESHSGKIKMGFRDSLSPIFLKSNKTTTVVMPMKMD